MSPETQQPALQQLLLHVSNYSNYYKRLFREKNINVDAIRTVADLAQLPFTTKDDLAQYNDDFLCVPKSRITDFVTTSGTLSDPAGSMTSTGIRPWPASATGQGIPPGA